MSCQGKNAHASIDKFPILTLARKVDHAAFVFPHRASAAFLAIAFLLAGDNFLFRIATMAWAIAFFFFCAMALSVLH